jgi:sterol desaturase/sphingolipid hydroxylase (fatty acid hydroxylase superfamily)
LWDHIALDTVSFFVLGFGTWIAHEIIWLVCNLQYLLIEKFRLFQQYKIQNGSPNNFDEMTREFWFALKGHFIFLLPVTLFIGYPIFRLCNVHYGPLPSLSQFLGQFIFFNVMEDTMFYWIHRWFHTRSMFLKYHYIHHKYRAPYSLVGEIAHPIEFLLNFLLPTILPPLLAGLFHGVQIMTLWFWFFFRSLRSTEAHSGYVLPWHLAHFLKYVGYQGAAFHDLHHSGIHYNFGSFVWWDRLCGTFLSPETKLHSLQQRKQTSE